MQGPWLFFLVLGKKFLHELVVDCVDLLVAVQGGEDLLAVFQDGLEDHEAQLLFVLGFLAFVLGGEEGQVGLAVIFDGVEMFQLELVAVVIGDGDEICAVLFAHAMFSFVYLPVIVPSIL